MHLMNKFPIDDKMAMASRFLQGSKGKNNTTAVFVLSNNFFITTFNGLPVLVMVCGLTWVLTETPKKIIHFVNLDQQLISGTNSQHALFLHYWGGDIGCKTVLYLHNCNGETNKVSGLIFIFPDLDGFHLIRFMMHKNLTSVKKIKIVHLRNVENERDASRHGYGGSAEVARSRK